MQRRPIIQSILLTEATPYDDDCLYYSWRNNIVIAFGTLSSFHHLCHGCSVSLFLPPRAESASMHMCASQCVPASLNSAFSFASRLTTSCSLSYFLSRFLIRTLSIVHASLRSLVGALSLFVFPKVFLFLIFDAFVCVCVYVYSNGGWYRASPVGLDLSSNAR